MTVTFRKMYRMMAVRLNLNHIFIKMLHNPSCSLRKAADVDTQLTPRVKGLDLQIMVAVISCKKKFPEMLLS